jgi:ribosomal-protein-alanine N-acetyltransferase
MPKGRSLLALFSVKHMPVETNRLATEHLFIRRLESKDTDEHLALLLRNRKYLQPFEPIRPESYFTHAGQEEMVRNLQLNWKHDRGYGFGIFLKEKERLIGRVNLSNVVRGAWQNCTIGYWIDQDCQGRGWMTEAVRLALRFAFEYASLHRVQAAAMPRNQASVRVLEKVGFRYEGLAKHYLQINGVWEDHLIYAITREDW